MATSTDSNPPAKDQGSLSGRDSAAFSASGKDLRGLSAFSESQMEKTILRRGLATLQEIEQCKAIKAKMVAQKEEAPGLLQIMVAAKVVTPRQADRLVKEVSPEHQKALDIPGYTDIKPLGKGSMGVVYRAKQVSVDRTVAVKVLLESLAENREFIKRFQREAQIAAKLQHNNIVGVIDAGEANGRHYFVMEYVEGTSIKDELEKGKVYEEKEAVKIVLAVAEALKHADERGLIHRDIKPENIILTKQGYVKLADLGLARPTNDEQWANAEAGMAIGTPYYISPEQVRGQTHVDIRTDIYSLGATLYHMVTGRVPYEGDSPSEVMRKHVDKNTPITPPDHLNRKLSSGLGEVVETMMAKNRENRYRTPDDLILDLKCLLQDARPIIAVQKADALANLAEGEAAEDEEDEEASEAQMLEWAGYLNSRNTIIAALAAMLVLSVLTNIVILVL